jgi:predicted transposase/invertase (TIGR01784 family)
MFTHPKNKDRVLLAFLRHYLRRPDITSDDINVADPRLAPEERGEKYPIVDVLINLPDLSVHLEIQRLTYRDTRDRILYYHSNIFGRQLKEGNEYKKIKQVITLCITAEELINESPDYFHNYLMHDAKRGVTLTKKSRIDVLELCKIPEEYDDSPEWIWGSLFKADKEDEFDMLASRYP